MACLAFKPALRCFTTPFACEAAELSLVVQVSRCERFGYGVMMTQVAATAPGVLALHKSGKVLLPCHRFCGPFSRSLSVFSPLSRGSLHLAGFVRTLIAELWSALECSSEDARAVRPKVTPLEPIDRSCRKVPRQ